LLKFDRDKKRWRYWLFEAKKRYGLCVLNYIVTSNHIHLLVVDTEKDTISKSLQLVAGRTAQEYNFRKKRKGAFWEDRYHATAVQTNEYLVKCMVYIDLNMVRAGVVKHPAEWPFGGYNEIQTPKRKNVLINYERLTDILGMQSYDMVQRNHKIWVNEEIATDRKQYEEKWTKSLAVGGKEFVENVKVELGSRANGRKIQKSDAAYQLREPARTYKTHLGAEKGNIDNKNAHIWNINDV